MVVALLVVVLATRDSRASARPHSPLLGQIAPPTEGDTIDGGHFSMADQRGRWVVLNFFASWCVPCLEEHPELAAFDAAHRAEGDAVLVSTTFDDRADDARAFFDEHGGTWPVIDDPENSIGVAYGVAQVPETFVIAPTAPSCSASPVPSPAPLSTSSSRPTSRVVSPRPTTPWTRPITRAGR